MAHLLNIILLSISIMTGCGQKAHNKADTLIFSKFPKESKIIFKDFFPFENGGVRRIYPLDSSLLIWNGRGEGGSFFYQYNLPKMDLVNSFIKMGRGRAESLGPLSGGSYHKILWVYDVVIRKVITIDISKSSNTKPSLVKEYKIPNYYFSTHLRDSLSLLVTGSEDTSNYKIQELDLKSGQETNRFGSYLDVPEGVPLTVWKKAHESSLFVNPAGNKAVLAYRITDKIEVYDLKTKKSKTIIGPENFKAEYTAYKAGKRDMVQRNEKSRFAFLNGVESEKYIYLLYSGNNHESEFRDNGKYIFVYDWNGQPVAKFTLDRPVSCFAVSDDGNTLYGFDPATNYIIKAKLKI